MAKSSKRQNNPSVTASDRAPKDSRGSAALDESDIARRAYDLYQARGGEHGHDVADWLQAERELRVAQK